MHEVMKIKFKETAAGLRAYYRQRVGGFPDRWIIISVEFARQMITVGKGVEVSE